MQISLIVMAVFAICSGPVFSQTESEKAQNQATIAMPIAANPSQLSYKLDPKADSKENETFCSIKWPDNTKFEKDTEYVAHFSDHQKSEETTQNEQGIFFTTSITDVVLVNKADKKKIAASVYCSKKGTQPISLEEQKIIFSKSLNIKKIGSIAQSKTKVFYPVFLLSTGGYTGMFTTGVGTYVTPYILIKGTIGYTPASQIGNKNGLVQYTGTVEVHPFAKLNIKIPVKNDYKIYIDPLYLSYGITYSPDKDLFHRLPSQYPTGYYSGTADRALISYGSAIGLSRGKTKLAEFNIGMHYLQREEVSPLAVETKHVRLSDLPKLGSLGLGLTIYLDGSKAGKK